MESTNGYSIATVSLRYGSYSVTYTTNHQAITSLAEFQVTISGGTTEDDQTLFYLACTRELAIPPQLSISGETQDNLVGFKQIENAITGAVGHFAELQKEFHKANEELRRRHLDEIEAIKLSFEEQKEIQNRELIEERRRIADQQRELDDRSNTHVRREIRKELKSAITESLRNTTLSSGFEGRRKFVRFAYLFGLLALFSLAAFYTLYLNSTIREDIPGAIWVAGVKASVSAISFVGFLLLYLKWETQWLTQQANFETVLASTRVDIDRASWIAETLLEWNRASSKDIPIELLESFSRRLFDWDAKLEENSSDSLASSILGSAGRVQLGPDGAHVEFGRRGVRKLSQS
jgi:hypothetical protein